MKVCSFPYKTVLLLLAAPQLLSNDGCLGIVRWQASWALDSCPIKTKGHIATHVHRPPNRRPPPAGEAGVRGSGPSGRQASVL